MLKIIDVANVPFFNHLCAPKISIDIMKKLQIKIWALCGFLFLSHIALKADEGM